MASSPLSNITKRKGGKSQKTSHVYLAQSFEGNSMSLLTVKGSAMLSRPVLLRSTAAAALSQFYWVVDRMRPDSFLANVDSFYIMVLGS